MNSNPDSAPKRLLMNFREGAVRANVSLRTIHYWRASGRLDGCVVEVSPGRKMLNVERFDAAIGALPVVEKAHEPHQLLRGRIEAMKKGPTRNVEGTADQRQPQARQQATTAQRAALSPN
jgi:hypothetical protein